MSSQLTVSDDALPNDELGTSVALNENGTVLVAGAPQPNPIDPGPSGKAYLFNLAASPVSRFRLDPSTPEPFSFFGFAVAIDASGTRVVLGAPGTGAETGAAFLSVRDAPRPACNESRTVSRGAEVGASVAISADGQMIVVECKAVVARDHHRGATRLVVRRLPPQAHRLADWIADYLEDPERYPVLSRVAPGDIRDAPARARAGATANRSTRSSPTSSASSFPASRTGTIPASSPTSRSPAARPASSRSSSRRRSTCRRCCGGRRRRRPSSRKSRSAGCASCWACRTASRASSTTPRRSRRFTRSPPRAKRRCRDVRAPGLAGRADVAPLPRLLLRARALVGRQGRDPARPRTRRAAPDSRRRRVPHAARRARARDRRRSRRGPAAARRRRDGRHDVEHERRSGRGDRGDLRARAASGCTSTPPTRASPRWCPGYEWILRGAERADSLVVNPHKWLFTPFDLQRALLPPHGRACVRRSR